MIKNCPICSQELVLIDYKDFRSTSKKLRCNNSYSHFEIVFTESNNFYCSLDINNFNCQWYFQSQTIYLQRNGYHPGKTMRSIPWFVPDFDDMDKLLNKLKLYTVLL